MYLEISACSFLQHLSLSLSLFLIPLFLSPSLFTFLLPFNPLGYFYSPAIILLYPISPYSTLSFPPFLNPPLTFLLLLSFSFFFYPTLQYSSSFRERTSRYSQRKERRNGLSDWIVSSIYTTLRVLFSDANAIRT